MPVPVGRTSFRTDLHASAYAAKWTLSSELVTLRCSSYACKSVARPTVKIATCGSACRNSANAKSNPFWRSYAVCTALRLQQTQQFHNNSKHNCLFSSKISIFHSHRSSLPRVRCLSQFKMHTRTRVFDAPSTNFHLQPRSCCFGGQTRETRLPLHSQPQLLDIPGKPQA